MKLASCFALALVLCARGAEDGPVLPTFYARDEHTEIALSPSDNGGESFEFRVYGDAREGRVIYHGGDLTKGAEGTLHYEAEVEGKKSAVTITGQLGDDTLKVEASGIEKLGSGPADVQGSYRKLSLAETLKRARLRYESADALLNADYQSVRATLNTKEKAELRDSQRDWIEVRDQRAAWETRGTDNAKELPAYWDEVLSQTVTRISFLKVYTGKDVPAGLSGEYGDFGGGSLSLELTKASLRFSIDVVRGPSSHLGDISGTALRKNDRLYIYKEKIPKEEQSPDREPAELTFTVVDAHRVRIVGKNTSAHHGARAYFDGLYYKTGKLEKPFEVD